MKNHSILTCSLGKDKCKRGEYLSWKICSKEIDHKIFLFNRNKWQTFHSIAFQVRLSKIEKWNVGVGKERETNQKNLERLLDICI